MALETLAPVAAFAAFENDPELTYVDVRAVAEFAVRHPKTAKGVNVPWVFFHPTTKETHANDSFLLVMNDVFDKAAKLVIGADEGGRAAEAAAALVDDGFSNVTVMSGGMPGWKQLDLPVTADNRDGVSYVSLLMQAKRRK